MRIPDLSIIEKTLNSEATSEESCEVTRWSKTPGGQAWLAERTDQDEGTVHMEEEETWIGRPIPSAVVYQDVMRQLRRQKVRRSVAYTATVSIPIALIMELFIHINSQVDLLTDDGYDKVYVPNEEHTQALFQDGNKIHLNSGSRIRYSKKFDLSERKVYLEEEAWFEVAKNKNRPFTVSISYMDMKVLGTTFDVKAYPEEGAIFVALETGSTELKSRSFKSYQLRPEEKAVYNRASRRCKVLRSHGVKVHLTWRRNVLVFKSAPLSDVMKTLTRTYDMSFDMKNSAALQYTYVITTDSVNLTTVLKELEKITPVLFEEKGGKIEVRMKE